MKLKLLFSLTLGFFFGLNYVQAQTTTPVNKTITTGKKIITVPAKKTPARTRRVVVKAPTTLVKNVQVENIEEWLCPSALLRGDREFDGNGPRIKCEVKLSIGTDSTTLWADIYFNAKETKNDWSETEGRWRMKIFDAPYGEKIVRIKTDAASRTQFISPKAGAQILFPGSDLQPAVKAFLDGVPFSPTVLATHNIKPDATGGLTPFSVNELITTTILRGNQVVKIAPTEGNLVKYFYIVGDTGGGDISDDDNCNDDTRIEKIEFWPVQIEYRKG